MKVRTRPIVVDAMRYVRGDEAELEAFVAKGFGLGRFVVDDGGVRVFHLRAPNLGVSTVYPGDWIVREPGGMLVMYSAERFAKLYAPKPEEPEAEEESLPQVVKITNSEDDVPELPARKTGFERWRSRKGGREVFAVYWRPMLAELLSGWISKAHEGIQVKEAKGGVLVVKAGNGAASLRINPNGWIGWTPKGEVFRLDRDALMRDYVRVDTRPL